MKLPMLLPHVATLTMIGLVASLGLGQTPPAKPSGSAAPVETAFSADGVDAVRAPTALEKDILAAMSKLVTAFNESDTKSLVDTFLTEGELVDEEGVVYKGHAEIEKLAKSFFEKYPGVRTEAELESVRSVADIVFADGKRLISTPDGKSVSMLRFSSVWQKGNGGYKLASFRDFAEPQTLTPNEALQSLSWLLGEWVNEVPDTKVSIRYRWSDDNNYLLGDIVVTKDGKQMNSSERIAWDASEGKFRSWTFDYDGGFGESAWVETSEGWVLQSTAVTPEGAKGIATMTIVQTSSERITVKGTGRVVAGQSEPDYEFVLVKRPPVAGK